jgi:HlyD family type I secretion membrane fusion protein
MVNKTNKPTEHNTPATSMPAGLPPGMNEEQLQKLVAAMQQQQLAAMPKYKRLFMKFMQFIGPRFQSIVHDLDRFVNFIVQPSDKDRNDVVQAARGPILFGTYVAIVFFVFGGLWAAIAPLDSASAAIGTIMSSTQKKSLQHIEGGIVKEIFVKVGDRVKEGDPIIALDDVRFKAQRDGLLSQYRSLKSEESRLIAERDNLDHIEFSPKLLKDAEVTEVAKIFQTQRYVFDSKRALISNLEKHSEQRIAQNLKQIEGMKESKKVAEKNYAVLLERLNAHKSLFAKGIIPKAVMSKIEVEYAEAKGNDLRTDAEIMRLEQETLKIEIELKKDKSEFYARTLAELEKVQQGLGEVKERLRQAEDAYDKAVITSPVDGIINALNVTTISGVVGPGHVVAEVSPEKDFLIIEARIPPKNIGYITVGMKAKIRFSAFKSRTTPIFTGKVVSLAPDIVIDNKVDPRSGENAYYLARIEIDMDEFNKDAKRLGLVLIPGMQAEVQIITGTRTLLRYLLDPITDNMFQAFKEK